MSSDKHADLTSKLMFPYPNAFQTLDEQKLAFTARDSAFWAGSPLGAK